jgi:regulatory associated protein of mTOR
MTALAVHRSIPIVATGSHAQFIKIVSLDGDTLEVIRYHEEMAGHRIGPVGCLVFHPHKLLLASGGTDEIVGLYGPKKSLTATTKSKMKI